MTDDVAEVEWKPVTRDGEEIGFGTDADGADNAYYKMEEVDDEECWVVVLEYDDHYTVMAPPVDVIKDCVLSHEKDTVFVFTEHVR